MKVTHIYSYLLDDSQVESRNDTLSNASPRPGSSTSNILTPVVKTAAVKGMSLASKGGKTKSYEDALVKEDKLAPVITTSKAVPPSDNTGPPVVQMIQQPVMLVISERGERNII